MFLIVLYNINVAKEDDMKNNYEPKTEMGKLFQEWLDDPEKGGKYIKKAAEKSKRNRRKRKESQISLRKMMHKRIWK